MEDEEHEVYGQEIPVDGEDVDMGAAGDDAAKVRRRRRRRRSDFLLPALPYPKP